MNTATDTRGRRWVVGSEAERELRAGITKGHTMDLTIKDVPWVTARAERALSAPRSLLTTAEREQLEVLLLEVLWLTSPDIEGDR